MTDAHAPAPPGPDSLLCVEVTAAAADAGLEDLVESLLWALPISGLERQDETTFSDLVEDPRPRNAGSVRWRVYMEPPVEGASIADPVRRELAGRATVETWTLDDLSFMTAWKEFFRPARVSEHFVVHPPWDVPEVPEGVHRIEIEPGMAFGTGTHETTRLCLAALDRLVTPGRSLLDVGCGSGVLSIGAAHLEASPIAAVDHDADAVRIANENYEINRVSVHATVDPVGALDGVYDIVVANILPHILIELRHDLLARMAPGAVLLLSGIMDTQLARVREEFEACGVRSEREERDGDWWAIEMRAGS